MLNLLSLKFTVGLGAAAGAPPIPGKILLRFEPAGGALMIDT